MKSTKLQKGICFALGGLALCGVGFTAILYASNKDSEQENQHISISDNDSTETETTAESISNEKESEEAQKQEIKNKLLDSYMSILHKNGKESYFLTDLDKDGFCELWITDTEKAVNETYDASYEYGVWVWNIYGMDADGSAKLIGKTDTSYTNHSVNCFDDYVLIGDNYRGGMGIDKYSLSNGKIISKMVFEGNSFDEDLEKNMNNYARQALIKEDECWDLKNTQQLTPCLDTSTINQWFKVH